jgi:mono/diheme cytochrome c family protein
VTRHLPLLTLLAAALVACESDPCPEGGMVGSDAGLVVTAAEHGEGWGREDCAGCHSLPNLHMWSCTEGIDLEAIREEIHEVVEEEGEPGVFHACASCHGENGVAE